MFVPYERFQQATISDLTAEQYERLAPMADLILDDWTIGRAGRAVANGEALPDAVVTLYAALIENIPAIMEGTKIGKSGLVTSFSNGVDSYSFDVTKTMKERLGDTLGWMLSLLPVEWSSGVVSFEGGNKYA